jgi:hypothetical protein
LITLKVARSTMPAWGAASAQTLVVFDDAAAR